MNQGIRAWTLAALLGALLLGCGRAPDPASSGSGTHAGSVLVLAAASTKDVLQECATIFTRETGIAIRINADDSSKLATQIVNAAPGDLFLSANEKWAAFVKDKDFSQESVGLLGNQLVLVVPKGNPARINDPQDLLKIKRLAVAGPTVPAGIYARQALTKLGRWDDLENGKKVAIGENVRVTLTYVERGEAEAGIVYATDAAISDQVQTVYTFPAATHDPIVYPLVLLKGGAVNPGSRRFYDYLQSAPAAALFKKYGFAWLGKS